MGIKVQLNEDLTRYHHGLKEGIVGVTTMHRTRNDCFVKVEFPGIYCIIDILWKSLTIVDEEYLEEKRKKQEEMIQAMKENGNAELHWHHCGAYHRLSYEYTPKGKQRHACSNYFSKQAGELYADMRKAGVKVREFGVPREEVAYVFNRDYYNDIIRRKEERWQAIVTTGEAVAEWNRNGGYEQVELTYSIHGRTVKELFTVREKGMELLKNLLKDNVPLIHIGEPDYQNRRTLGM
jgi:hypothetical protein